MSWRNSLNEETWKNLVNESCSQQLLTEIFISDSSSNCFAEVKKKTFMNKVCEEFACGENIFKEFAALRWNYLPLMFAFCCCSTENISERGKLLISEICVFMKIINRVLKIFEHIMSIVNSLQHRVKYFVCRKLFSFWSL